MKASPKGKCVSFEVDCWYNEETEHLHLASNDPDIRGFHTTVSLKPDSIRNHRNLATKLTHILKQAGKPAPELAAA